MPYHIVKDGDKFKVENKDSGKVMGTFDSKTAADKQLAALYIHVEDAKGLDSAPKQRLMARPKPRFRYLTLDRSKLDAEKRTVPISFSSESPVHRSDKELGEFDEILSHDPADVDLSRMKDGAPFLVNHNTDDQVGVVEEAFIEGGLGRAVIRFSTSDRGEEIFKDIKDGIRKHISVGYEPTDIVSDTCSADGKRSIKFKWMPFEASTVPIPADTKVGVGRALARGKGKKYERALNRTYFNDTCTYWLNQSNYCLVNLIDDIEDEALENSLIHATGKCTVTYQKLCSWSDTTAAECVEASKECVEALRKVVAELEAADLPEELIENCLDCLEDTIELLVENAGGEATASATETASQTRSVDSAPKPEKQRTQISIVMPETKSKTAEEIRQDELTRIREIDATVELLCKDHPSAAEKFRAKRNKAVADGTDVRDFKASMVSEIPGSKPANEMTLAELTNGDIAAQRAYSFARGIQSCVTRKASTPDGLEGEVHQEMSKRVRFSSEGMGGNFWVPFDGRINGKLDVRAMVSQPMSRRQKRDLNVTTFGQGGAFVQTTVLTPIIEILRNRMVCDRLGVQGMAGLEGNVAIPRQTGAASAYALGEQVATAISTQALDQVLLTPHRVSAWNNYSRQLILQSSVDVENFMRDDLLKVTAIKWDYLILQGQGGAEPTGILNTTGIGSIQFGGTATWAQVVAFETALSVANADLGNMAYVTTPSTRGRWKAVAKTGVGVTSVVPIFLWDKGNWGDGSNDGEVNGYRAAATNQILNNLVFFGNWEDTIHALWGGYDVIVDPYKEAEQATVRIIVNTFGDVAVRHAQSYCVSVDGGNQ